MRGINVGKAKRIGMADLRELLESLGFEGVRTHGQSGNVVFEAKGTEPKLAAAIGAGIKSRFGMDVAVLVRSADELAAVVADNPLAGKCDPKELHFSFLSAAPPEDKVAAVDKSAYLPDEFAFGDRVIYVRRPNGIRESKLPDWRSVLGVEVTERNWNTTLKLSDLASAG